MTTINPTHAPFETLVVGEQPRLVRFCSCLTGDSYAAEDLAQETLLIAWRQRHKVTDPSGFTYLAHGNRSQRLPPSCAH